jgi:hypothetical protein
MNNNKISFIKFRRKPGRNKHGSSTVESVAIYEDEQRHSAKTNLLSNKPSLSSQKQSGRLVGSTNQDIPPVLPPRKPMDKKNSVQMQSAILNSSLLNNSSSQLSSNIVDDTSTSSLLAPVRILPNKEVRRNVYHMQLLCSIFYLFLAYVRSSYSSFSLSLSLFIFNRTWSIYIHSTRQINIFVLFIFFSRYCVTD